MLAQARLLRIGSIAVEAKNQWESVARRRVE
jgi:hypothetical protein